MMRNGRRKFKKTRLISMALAAVTCLSLLSGIAAPSAQAAESDDDMPIVLSLGDSYSSGEGCEPFYDQEKEFEVKVNEKSHDWVAHRSENSWPGMLEFNGKKLKNYKDTKWYFQAASGAETKHIYKENQIINYACYNDSIAENPSASVIGMPEEPELVTGTATMDIQLDIVDKENLKNKVDYVTVTIGGNDAGFQNIVETAAKQYGLIIHGKLEKALNQAYKDVSDGRLEKTYKKIAAAVGDNATILVIGYPKLISLYSPPALFGPIEAKQINDKIEEFDELMAATVEQVKNEGINIRYISVIEKFSGHEAYSINPYINGIRLTRTQDINQTNPFSSYSMHPNGSEKKVNDDKINCGIDVYAAAVQEVIDELESTRKKELEEKKKTEMAAHSEENTAFARFLYQIMISSEADTDTTMKMSDCADIDTDSIDVDSTTEINNEFTFNDFAIADFDGDGVNELALNYKSDGTSGIRLHFDGFDLYEYDSSTGEIVKAEYSNFSCSKDGADSIRFYTNGLVRYNYDEENGMVALSCFKDEDMQQLPILNNDESDYMPSRVALEENDDGTCGLYDISDDLSIGLYKTISAEQYKELTQDIASFEEIDVEVYDFNEENINYIVSLIGADVSDVEPLPARENLKLPFSGSKGFTYTRGMHAWSSDMTLYPDGTFEGNYHDSDDWDSGDGYTGTIYISTYHGSFKNIKRIDEYTYYMELESVSTDETEDVWIEDGVRYIASPAAGIDGGTGFYLYLPGKPVDELPQEYVDFYNLLGVIGETTLDMYGIYNVDEQVGFIE